MEIRLDLDVVIFPRLGDLDVYMPNRPSRNDVIVIVDGEEEDKGDDIIEQLRFLRTTILPLPRRLFWLLGIEQNIFRCSSTTTAMRLLQYLVQFCRFGYLTAQSVVLMYCTHVVEMKTVPPLFFQRTTSVPRMRVNDVCITFLDDVTK
jgi:hypothetical protein